MNLFKDTLANAITALRLNNNQFATRTELTRGQLSKFLAGPDLPKSETLVAICDALPPDHAERLVKAWIFGRVGPKYAAPVLTAATGEDNHPLLPLLDSLPAETAAAFVILITTARDDEDFRASMIRLASFLQPPTAEQSTHTGSPKPMVDGSPKTTQKSECADSADSPAISPKPKQPPATASIAALPPPPVVDTLLHSALLQETPNSTFSPAKRTETTYHPKKKGK